MATTLNDMYVNKSFPRQNGRVDVFTQSNSNALFALKDRIPLESRCTGYQNALDGILEESLLSKKYFSKENVLFLQQQIQLGVYEMSNAKWVIDAQDCDSLKIIMRAMYLRHVKNLPDRIDEQIQDINNHVLDYAVKQVYRDVKTYYKYLSDVSTMYKPIDRPQFSVEKSHARQLELKPFF